MQSTQGKLLYHLERSEHWQTIVDNYETRALQKAETHQQGRMRRSSALEMDPSYVAGTLLQDHFGYNSAVSNRNSHQRQAEIYGIAFLAGISRTAYDRTENGLALVETPTPIDNQ